MNHINNRPQDKLKIIALLALVLGALTFAGCQTMKGAGKDIEHAGEGIQKAAK